MAKNAMTEKAIKVWNYLKENDGTNMTATDIAIGMGLCSETDEEDVIKAATKSMNAVVTAGLQNKGYTKRVDATIEVETENGVTVKPIKFITLTDEGRAYDHEAATKADAEAAATKAE